ncbi:MULTISPECIES: hypothetical protein [Xenorhabdus]|uniref:hypothetical protein n=1 Tax=Xenorhabdus TaxID=626 RepID=UPI00064AD4A5|nr:MULTISPECIES: hypothetical protein [Xenorhabdus]KLU14270.1 hypothetical protein AAY47_17400 [Xenorhabdus griffiniae]KOP34781.1 hypothetical protein AFK69_02805 [Xenorhabdus sp. GDc328]
MRELPRGVYKTNRKIHNQAFKYRQLKYYQYSTVVVGDTTALNIHVYKWFILLIAIPMLIYGSIVVGLMPVFRELRDVWWEPVKFDTIRQIPDGLLRYGK